MSCILVQRPRRECPVSFRSRGTTRRVDDDGNGTTVILSRGDGEGSQVAHFELLLPRIVARREDFLQNWCVAAFGLRAKARARILRRASPTQDDGGVIRSWRSATKN